MSEPLTVEETVWARWGRRAVTVPLYLLLGSAQRCAAAGDDGAGAGDRRRPPHRPSRHPALHARRSRSTSSAKPSGSSRASCCGWPTGCGRGPRRIAW